MNFKRIIKHLTIGRAAVRRKFPLHTLNAIERSIREVESNHNGQIRFAVEGGLTMSSLLSGQTARERSLEVFSKLRIWDTEHNNGVLIYLSLADRSIEIIADRGIHVRSGQETWETICREMEAKFREGQFEAGVLAGIQAVGEHLTHHYPSGGRETNEMPDSPVIL